MLGGRFVAAAGESTTDVLYGMYATLQGYTNPTDYAGYFEGNVYSTGSYLPSDEALKTNIQDLSGSLERVMQMRPVSYDYLTDQLPSMNLPTGTQFGLLANELQEVRPDLVREAVQPPTLDADGAQVADALTFKAMRMEGIIPDLIGSIQALQARLDQLEAQLATCCASGGARSEEQNGTEDPTSGGNAASIEQERLLISPNPFIDHTTLTYFVVETGKVSLQVSDNAGRPISTLREEQAMTGAFTYEWDTQHLAAGTYFVALVVDGNVVVKRAVKVGER